MPNITASDEFRLPIFDTLKDIYVFLWSTRRDLMLIAAIPVVALTVYRVAAVYLFGAVEPGTKEGERLPALWDVFALYMPSLVLYTMFAVAWHRRYLIKSETPTVWSALRWDLKKTRFLFRSILIWLIATALVSVPIMILTIFGLVLNFAAAAPISPPVDVATLSSVLILAASIMFFILYLRLSMWLPVTAIEAPFSLLESVRLGRSNSWRLLTIVLGAEIGPAILLLLFGNVAHGLPASSPTADLVIGLTRTALTYTVLAAGITALSVAYDRLLARISNDPLYSQGGMPFD